MWIVLILSMVMACRLTTDCRLIQCQAQWDRLIPLSLNTRACRLGDYAFPQWRPLQPDTRHGDGLSTFTDWLPIQLSSVDSPTEHCFTRDAFEQSRMVNQGIGQLGGIKGGIGILSFDELPSCIVGIG
jgi:hypothetical protein